MSFFCREYAQIDDTGQVGGANETIHDPSVQPLPTKAQVAKFSRWQQVQQNLLHLPRTVDLRVLERFFRQDVIQNNAADAKPT